MTKFRETDCKMALYNLYNGSCNDDEYEMLSELIDEYFARLLREDGHKVEDGIYAEFFAVKNGVRYNAKVIDVKEMSTTLVNGLMNGIESLWT